MPLVRLRLGDCVSVMGSMSENSIDTILCDPPYGIEFMGKEWDCLGVEDGDVLHDPSVVGGFQDGAGGNPYSRSRIRYGTEPGPMQAWHEEWLAACFRVLQPGGHIQAFGATRTFHRLAAAMTAVGFEDIGFEAWNYASGFPKNLNVGKALDNVGGDALAWQAFAKAYSEAVKTSAYTYADIDKILGLKSSSCYWARTDHRGGMPPREHWEVLRDLLHLNEDFVRLYDGAEREILQERTMTQGGGSSHMLRTGEARKVRADITAPATTQAKTWDGWGTALKPAWEPVLVGRKPA